MGGWTGGTATRAEGLPGLHLVFWEKRKQNAHKRSVDSGVRHLAPPQPLSAPLAGESETPNCHQSAAPKAQRGNVRPVRN